MFKNLFKNMLNWKWWLVVILTLPLIVIVFTLAAVSSILITIGEIIDVRKLSAPKFLQNLFDWYKK